jgi:hypothetical protein
MINDLLAWLKGLALKLIRQKVDRRAPYAESHMRWELLPYSFKIDWYVKGNNPPDVPVAPRESGGWVDTQPPSSS